MSEESQRDLFDRGLISARKGTIPIGAALLLRPDTKLPKAMGWSLLGRYRLLIDLALKVKRPNEAYRGMTPGAAMGIRAHNAKCRDWSEAAIRTSLPRASEPRGIRWIRLTRISSGRMDDDGLVASFKFIRDGVARGLHLNDRDFSIAGQNPEKIPIFYDQLAPGKRGVFAVRIELLFSEAE